MKSWIKYVLAMCLLLLAFFAGWYFVGYNKEEGGFESVVVKEGHDLTP